MSFFLCKRVVRSLRFERECNLSPDFSVLPKKEKFEVKLSKHKKYDGKFGIFAVSKYCGIKLISRPFELFMVVPATEVE